MAVTQHDHQLDDRTLVVRQAGDPGGSPVLYFHGTPGSSLDVSLYDQAALAAGVRLVAFDRPGYGGSTAVAFSLSSVARDTLRLADDLGLGRFATLGLSGGGPFALACGALGEPSVTRACVAGGVGPFEHVPGAMDMLDETDTAALAHLPGNPHAAAAGFGEGFAQIREHLLANPDGGPGGMEAQMSGRDRELNEDPAIGPVIGASIREALRVGVQGGAWDNVAWVGPWDFDLADVAVPVLLWWGDEDGFSPRPMADYLAVHLPDARLVVNAGEGHFSAFDHLDEIFAFLTGS